jgi:uncharacterized membrane protein
MRPTRIGDLGLFAVAAGVVAWLVIRNAYESVPDLRWFVPLSIGVLAIVEVVVGVQLRARIQRRRGAALVEPLVAARALALAKASSIVGALLAGVWGGLLVYVIPRRDTVSAARSDTVVGVVGLVSALALVGAGLWLEYCCRTPPGNDDDDAPPAPADYDVEPPRR